MSEKIRAVHLERPAYVYVRQSTMHQVRHNTESRGRQYGLSDRARALGFRSVVVVDDDLGRSGGGQEERPGFERLLAAVCRGQVGAVLAVEASRLARNNRDWHHLVDLCALTESLVIDHDGIYDPRSLNDRLLLGLKGTMSEFELALIRQRSQEALKQMIARGEVLWEVPVGYVRTRGHGCEMIPDRRVQEAIRGLFAKFCELGSARQVLLWYRQERLPLPRSRHGAFGIEVSWDLPVYTSVLAVLKNPMYAGVFAYGRSRTRTVVVEGKARRTSGHEVPREEWTVLIRDHHPGYISWEEYLRNQDQLEANAGMRGAMKGGAAKGGAALLAGMLRCGRCGRKLHVGYSGIGGRVVRYYCRGAHVNHGMESCISFGGLRVDQLVVEKVLEAVQPAGVEAALQAWDEAARRQDEKHQALSLAVQQARYEAERLRRQYDAVDPENRLVAAELEKRWNEALQTLTDLEGRVAETCESSFDLTEADRRRLLDLGEDLEAVWHHPEASSRLKKRFLRTVLEEIVVDVSDKPPELLIRMHWAGGVHTLARVRRQRAGQHSRCTNRTVVELVRELAKVCSDLTITQILNRLGYRTGAGNSWTVSRVASLRSYQEIPVFMDTPDRPWVTMAEAARALDVSPTVVRRLLVRGVLPGKQIVPSAPWVIERTDLERPHVRAVARTIHQGRKVPLPVAGQETLPLDTTT
jgi:DNA invertase Pin-like site-specific DNA recombinase